VHARERQTVLDPRAQTFAVICVGEALLSIAERDASLLRPGGGAITAALALATQGVRVGLASVLEDDTSGRDLLAKVAASGVDIGGVARTSPSTGILFVRGGARQLLSLHEEEHPIAVPEGWSSQVLLLSGLSPVVSHAAAFCKAARVARRAGSVVVVDVNARWHLWQGRDARTIRMVLREADVVWCSAQDLFGLNMDLSSLRSALRDSAVLVFSDGVGRASATGPFGEVAHALVGSITSAPLGEGDAFTAAICAELARVGHTDARDGTLWTRVLQRGHAAVMERVGN
jgi:2-dehydro-3-deoxygluconokinase